MATRLNISNAHKQEYLIPIQLTRAERISALSSAIMASVAVLSLMVGLYYNLRATHIKLFDIFIFESILIIMILSIIVWLIFHIQEEN